MSYIAGLDIGAKFIKAVLMKDKEVVARFKSTIGFDQKASIEEALSNLLSEGGVRKEDVSKIIATGAGRKLVEFADDSITEISAAAAGAHYLFDSARTVVDVGAEEGRAIKCDDKGKVVDFAVNEKCAAGAGAFTESMSRALELSLDEFAKISLESDREIAMNAQCTVFAESEVVSLLHSNVPKKDIARAIHDAIASRIGAMVRRVGLNQDVVVIGGLAKNVGFIDSLKRNLGSEILVPEDPEFGSAIGAALLGSN